MQGVRRPPPQRMGPSLAPGLSPSREPSPQLSGEGRTNNRQSEKQRQAPLDRSTPTGKPMVKTDFALNKAASCNTNRRLGYFIPESRERMCVQQFKPFALAQSESGQIPSTNAKHTRPVHLHPRPTKGDGRKGIFSKQLQARENGMVAALADMGLVEMAKAKLKHMQYRGCTLDKQAATALVSMKDGQHEWRSKWSTFRPVQSFEQNLQKHYAQLGLKHMRKVDKSVRRLDAKNKADLQFRADMHAELLELNRAVENLDTWELQVCLPSKAAGYIRIIHCDGSFTLNDVKQALYEMEGFHPSQQILHILRPLPKTVLPRGSIPKHLFSQMHALAIKPEPPMQKVLLEASEEQTLASLRITSETLLELDIDKAVGKELQRQMLMQEIGMEGETFLVKTEEAFNRFDIDEVLFSQLQLC